MAFWSQGASSARAALESPAITAPANSSTSWSMRCSGLAAATAAGVFTTRTAAPRRAGGEVHVRAGAPPPERGEGSELVVTGGADLLSVADAQHLRGEHARRMQVFERARAAAPRERKA